jgi:serine/threonine protein kinase
MIFDNHISKAQDSWASGCFIYNVLTNSLPFDLTFIYNKDSRDDEHLIQLFSLLGPLPAKLKHSWPRYEVYFDNEGQLKKLVEDDDSISYPELENLPEDDCRSTTSDAMDNGLQQENDEAIPVAPPDNVIQECFDPDLYPSIIKVCERKGRKDQDPPESIADYTALNPPLRERWLNEKHPDLQLKESELVLDLLQGLLTYDPDQRLSTKAILQHAWIRNYCASDRTR